MEKALQFYCDYVASQDCFSVLPPMLVAAIRATVQNSESHICRLLFKLAVEMDMMMNVLAAAMEIPEERGVDGRRSRRVMTSQTNEKHPTTTGRVRNEWMVTQC